MAPENKMASENKMAPYNKMAPENKMAPKNKMAPNSNLEVSAGAPSLTPPGTRALVSEGTLFLFRVIWT